MNYRNTGAVFILALAALASGAGAQAAGTYKLTEVAGDELPAVIEEEEGCRGEVNSATLTLDAKGHWTLRSKSKEICGSRVENESDSDHGSYTVTGNTVRFTDMENDKGKKEKEDALEELGEGTLEGNTLRIRIGSSDRFLVFVKQ